jgi:hypothetical protein
MRGIKRGTLRPDLVAIDDPDKNLTHNEEQLDKLRKVIDRGIGFLGGLKKSCGRIMLTTVENHFGVSALFTDKERKKSWRGVRYKFLCVPPQNETLWTDYVELRERDDRDGTELAHVFYLAHRADMDLGAVVANPNRHPDGSLSGLQWYYNQIARTSREDVETELQNNPPIEELPVDNGLTAHLIQRRLSGVPHKIVPANCVKVTRGIDINRRMAHYVTRAWAADGTGYTIDYDIEETNAKLGSDEGLEEALIGALLRIFEASEDTPYTYEDGSAVPVSTTFVDSRWMTGAIRQAVKTACETWGTRFYTIMGCGKSGRCKTASYRELLRTVNPDRKMGEGYHLERIPGVCWEAKCDKERFVLYEHSRWMAPDPGALWLYGEKVADANAVRLSAQERAHQSYAKHIVNEKQIEEMYKGAKRLVWKATNMVHYLDASCYASVGAVKEGIVLPGFNKKAPLVPVTLSKPRPTRESLERLW